MPTPYYDQDGITIYHGDCRDVIPALADAPIDVTITDPPYNIGLDYSEGDRRIDYADWTAEWFRLAPRPLVVTPGIVNLALWLGMERPRWVCAWVKPNQNSPSALNGWNVWEPILVYGRHHKPVGHDAWTTYINAAQRYVGDHPCPKDLPSWSKFVEAFSLPGQTILDPFVGSGTTLVASRNLGRCAIGIEIEERYCEIAVRRLAQQVLPMGVA